MEAIVLAGGKGTRLRSVVKDVPKPMADINGKPYLHYLLAHLARSGVDCVILSIGYKGHIIQNYFGENYLGLAIRYVVENKPLGTGGAILKALIEATEENVLVLNGDTYFPIDLQGMLEYHCERKAEITIALKLMHDITRYGTVIVSGDNITGFRSKEHAAAGYINGGIYVINKVLTKTLSRYSYPFSFEDHFLVENISTIDSSPFIRNDYFVDIGVPDDYFRAISEFAAQAGK